MDLYTSEVSLNMQQAYMFLPHILFEFPEIVMPSYMGHTDYKLEVERRFTTQEIMDLYSNKHLYDRIVPDLKNISVIEDINILGMKLIKRDYSIVSEYMSSKRSVVQVVYSPITLKDMWPGDTQIHYCLYTIRRLMFEDDVTQDDK